MQRPRTRRDGLADNLRYLREVVTRYGWIDIPRFGKPVAATAILIVKHSINLPLLQAALPVAERDAKEHGGGKELVSILVDDLLLDLGHKQKYDPDHRRRARQTLRDPRRGSGKVEEDRKALGIPPGRTTSRRRARFSMVGRQFGFRARRVRQTVPPSCRLRELPWPLS